MAYPRVVDGLTYTVINASASETILGGVAGVIGEYLSHLVIVPTAAAAGAVSLKDGSGSAITLFAGGTLSEVRPIAVPWLAYSNAGSWRVTTGSNVTVIAVWKPN